MLHEAYFHLKKKKLTHDQESSFLLEECENLSLKSRFNKLHLYVVFFVKKLFIIYTHISALKHPIQN